LSNLKVSIIQTWLNDKGMSPFSFQKETGNAFPMAIQEWWLLPQVLGKRIQFLSQFSLIF
jgi:hypothetical protein